MIAQSQKHIKHNGEKKNNTPQALAITGNNTTGITCFECMLHNIMLSDDGQLSTTIFFFKCLSSSISCNIQGVYIWQYSGGFFLHLSRTQTVNKHQQ